MAETSDDKPQWLKVRERAQQDPEFQNLAKRAAKRGTHRNTYLLLDRIFQVSQGGKPDPMTVYTEDGPKLISRDTHFRFIDQIHSRTRLARRRRREKLAQATRKDLRRRRRRGAHRR